jgi:hydrogenase-4 component B
VFKALLFLGAGSFGRAVHDLGLDRLGGLLRRMPWTGAAFGIGAMAIAGLPPLSGFASEWLTLQSLLHVGASGRGWTAVAGAVATAGLAATAALAVLCFVKVTGLVLLGPPRRPACAQATEVVWSMRAATGFLAAVCVLLGALPGLLLPRLSTLSGFGFHITARPGFVLAGTGSLPTLSVAAVLVALTGVLVVARGGRRAEPAPVWVCGQPVEPALAWTSAGFTKPLRLMLEAVLRPRREVTVVTERGVVRRVRYSAEVPHLFDTVLYRPVLRAALAGAGVARRLQSGSLRGYVLYLLGLVVVLLVLVRAGALG